MKIILKSILLAFVFLAACSKESSNNIGLGQDYCVPDEKTIEIPPFQGTSQTNSYQILDLDTFAFGLSCVNPNNENEFVYAKIDRLSKDGPRYFLYNRLTKNNLQIITPDRATKTLVIMSNIKWSKKNWLIFSDYFFNVYKIKPNGDSLTQLTFTGTDMGPEWNYDGTMFITFHMNNNIRFNMVRDENGNIIDTIKSEFGTELFSGTSSWQHPKYIIFGDFYGEYLYDFSTKQKIQLLDEEGSKNIGGLRWINEVECIHSGSSGIFIFNTLTKQNRQLRKTTNANSYENVHILSNKQMLASRAYAELWPTFPISTKAVRSSICLLNPCDTVITEINLRQ